MYPYLLYLSFLFFNMTVLNRTSFKLENIWISSFLNLKQGKADMKPNIAAKPKNNALRLHEIKI